MSVRARRPVSVTALAFALTAGVALASPGAPAVGGSQPDTATALAEANAVLDVRESALAGDDLDGWLATVDPQAPQTFRDAQARQFEGLRSVPLERFALTARLDDSGDLAPEGDRFLPETRMTYRLRGYDDRDAVDVLWLSFVERGGRWYVASDTDLSDLGLDTARGLWDGGGVRTVATEHFLVLHHPAQADRARHLADLAERAMTTVRQRWDRAWSERVPIVLPGSVEELEALLQSTIDLDKFVAFVSYGTIRDDGWEPTAPRMYIQDRNLSRYGEGFQEETLVHELVHAAGVPDAGPFVPAWMHEGVADWVATGRSTSERPPSGSDGVLPRDFEFSTGSQDDILRAYRESRSAISYLAARGSIATPSAFFAEAGRDKTAPGSLDRHVDDALRRAASIGVGDLQRGWSSR